MSYKNKILIVIQLLIFIGCHTYTISQEKKKYMTTTEWDSLYAIKENKRDSLNKIVEKNMIDSLLQVKEDILNEDIKQGWVQFSVTGVEVVENRYFYNSNTLEKYGDSAVVWIKQMVFISKDLKTIDKIMLLGKSGFTARFVLYKPDKFMRTFSKEIDKYGKVTISDKSEIGYIIPGEDNSVIALLFKEIMKE